MQAIWKGTISFGLVSIPIKVYSATEERNISFRQVHEADGGRIRYKRVCEVDGDEVPYSDIGKGYELPDGRMVILTDEDFAELPLPSAKSIDVLEFVPIEPVDPLFFAKAYYLGVDGGVGAKPYVLLRDALSKTGQCALVKVAIRTRETLALLREKDGALVLQTMLWPEEVRNSDFAAPDDSIKIREQEIAMAESYISTLRGNFEPERYHSEYREALERLVEAKSSGLPMPEVEEDDPGETAQVVDLVAALRASVDAAKKRREAGSAAGPTERELSSGAGAKSVKPSPKTGTADKKSSTAVRSSANKKAGPSTNAAKSASRSKAKKSTSTAARKGAARKSA
ncbi:MAG: Ku protein [Nocardioidaceae bacterium]